MADRPSHGFKSVEFKGKKWRARVSGPRQGGKKMNYASPANCLIAEDAARVADR
jgi:hypothetical protein